MTRCAAIALCLLGLWLPRLASSAQLFFSGNLLEHNVGDLMTLDIRLGSSSSPAGPGDIEVTFSWGEVLGPLSIANTVLAGPITLAPGFAFAPGSGDCSDGVGLSSGSCALHLTAAAPIAVPTLLAFQVNLWNYWQAPPGYEICTFNAPDCVLATAVSGVALRDETVFGDPAPDTGPVAVGTGGILPRIRPIPEPGSAALVALGLAALARRRRD